jgi:hypothetical protein
MIGNAADFIGGLPVDLQLQFEHLCNEIGQVEELCV